MIKISGIAKITIETLCDSVFEKLNRKTFQFGVFAIPKISTCENNVLLLHQTLSEDERSAFLCENVLDLHFMF